MVLTRCTQDLTHIRVVLSRCTQDLTHIRVVLSRCTQDSNLDALHTAEMAKAAEEAKKKYLEQHPELAGTTLKHDPLKLIDNTSTAALFALGTFLAR